MKVWKEWSMLIKIQECILAISSIIYIVSLLSGGMFTAYFSTMWLIIIGVITAIVALAKREYSVAILNVLVALVGFITYVTVA